MTMVMLIVWAIMIIILMDHDNDHTKVGKENEEGEQDDEGEENEEGEES